MKRYSRDDYAQAARLYRESIGIRRGLGMEEDLFSRSTIWGEDHPDTNRVKQQLAALASPNLTE